MPKIVRDRTIRPSSRKETSSYRINIKEVSPSDTLIVNIDHESKSFRKSFKFRGNDVVNKKSLAFKVKDHGTHIEVLWTSTQPING